MEGGQSNEKGCPISLTVGCNDQLRKNWLKLGDEEEAELEGVMEE